MAVNETVSGKPGGTDELPLAVKNTIFAAWHALESPPPVNKSSFFSFKRKTPEPTKPEILRDYQEKKIFYYGHDGDKAPLRPIIISLLTDLEKTGKGECYLVETELENKNTKNLLEGSFSRNNAEVSFDVIELRSRILLIKATVTPKKPSAVKPIPSEATGIVERDTSKEIKRVLKPLAPGGTPVSPSVSKPVSATPQAPTARTLPPDIVSANAQSPDRPTETQETEPGQTLSFGQVLFGKILKNANDPSGPVSLAGDHRITGQTSWIPSKLIEGCESVTAANSIWPFGSTGQTVKSWPFSEKGGAIIKKTMEVDGKSYIGVGRLDNRSEEGVGKVGRRYTQTHFAFIPAEQWSVAAIPQLADMLKAEPMSKIDHEMPEIEINTKLLNQPLPEDWFSNEVKDLLIHIITGRPFSIQDWDIPVPDFLKRVYYALLCLPEEVARKISFGSGLYEMNGSVQIGHGAKAMGGMRKIGPNWRGAEGLDMNIAEEYIGAIEGSLNECKTPQDVINIATNISQQLLEKVKASILGNR